MCKAISGIVVKNNEDIKVYTLRHEDSHTQIREEYKIRDDDGVGVYQTPVELIPRTGIFDIKDMDFIFDDEKPSWWEDCFTESAKQQLFNAWLNRWDGKVLNFRGHLDLSSLTSIPEGVTLNAGGYLDLFSLTSIPKGVTLNAGGYLYLSRLTSLAEGVTLNAGKNLYLDRLTSIPKGVDVKVKKGNLRLKGGWV